MYGLMLLLAIAACRRADRLPLGEVGRRLGSRLPRRRLGRRLRDRRRAAVPRHHELERSPATSGGGRSRSGRAGSASGAGSCSASSSARGSCTAPSRACRLFMDAVAPGLLLAQGIGRWGNWFNQELFGKPTDLPWGLKIDRRSSRPATSGRRRDLPPDVPLRVHLRHRRRDPAAADRQVLQDQAAGLVRALRLVLHASAASSRSCSGSTRRTSTSGCG